MLLGVLSGCYLGWLHYPLDGETTRCLVEVFRTPSLPDSGTPHSSRRCNGGDKSFYHKALWWNIMGLSMMGSSIIPMIITMASLWQLLLAPNREVLRRSIKDQICTFLHTHSRKFATELLSDRGTPPGECSV